MSPVALKAGSVPHRRVTTPERGPIGKGLPRDQQQIAALQQSGARVVCKGLQS